MEPSLGDMVASFVCVVGKGEVHECLGVMVGAQEHCLLVLSLQETKSILCLHVSALTTLIDELET